MFFLCCYLYFFFFALFVPFGQDFWQRFAEFVPFLHSVDVSPQPLWSGWMNNVSGCPVNGSAASAMSALELNRTLSVAATTATCDAQNNPEYCAAFWREVNVFRKQWWNTR